MPHSRSSIWDQLLELEGAISSFKKAWHDGAEVSASGWRSGGPRFKSHPRLISQSWSSYQLNQLGSKAASDSTLKPLTLAGYQILVLYFFFTDYPTLKNNIWLAYDYMNRVHTAWNQWSNGRSWGAWQLVVLSRHTISAWNNIQYIPIIFRIIL